MKIASLQIIIIVILFYSCKQLKLSNSKTFCGHIMSEPRLDSNNNLLSDAFPYFTGDNYLYKNNCIISIGKIVNTTNYYDVKTSTTIDTESYQFAYLSTMDFYRYESMFDTAQCVASYKITDKTNYRGLIFKNRDEFTNIAQYKTLPDTVIATLNYKRYSVFYSKDLINPNDSSYVTYYFVLNKKKIPQQLQFPFKIDCLSDEWKLVQVDKYFINSKTFIRSRYRVIREYLTPEEEKVFAAWEKYAKGHTVK